MEKKKINLSDVASEASKGATELFGKAKSAFVKVADKTGDGTFDKDDVTVIAENMSTAAKNAADKVKILVDETNREKEIRRLRPIKLEDLNSVNFRMSSLIHIAEMDKQYAESDVCQGAIGYHSTEKGLDIVHIFRGNEETFGVVLYPDDSYELYCRDHIDRNKYIALDEYFYYLKESCVCELETVAQDLGAKYFRVTLMAEKKTFSKKDIKAKVSAKAKRDSASAEAEHNRASSSAIKVKVEAEAK